MIMRHNFSRHAWMYFVSHKHDAASAFEKFLADLRVEGTPSEVVIVRADDGGELMEGKFGKLCRERKIKQEFTTADSPEYNRVAERGLAMIESAALAPEIQASELFPGYSIPEGALLWAEAMNWACDAYNQTTTVANPGNRSPQEMFYGVTPQSSSIPFLKPGFCKFKRINKMDPKARECFFLGPARNHSSESKRVLVRTGKVIITINVTWAHVPLSRSPTVRPTPFVEGEGCDHGRDREFAALRAGEAKRLDEHIPGSPRATIFKGRTRAEKRRSKNTAQTTLISEEGELDIALHVEEENTLKQALQVDIEASVEMPTGKMQDLPPPPTAKEEVRRSPFRKAFESRSTIGEVGDVAKLSPFW